MGTFDLAGLGQIAASGVVKQADIVKNRDRVQAEAAEFKLRTNQAEALNDPKLIENKVEALNAGFKQLIDQQQKSETTKQFRLYMKSGDTNQLTNLFKNNPRISKQFQNLIAIERFDFNSPEDRSILARKGITEQNYNPNIHLKGITSDGNVDMFDALAFGAGTEALLDIQNEEADLFLKWMKLAGKEGNIGTLSELGKDATLLSSVNEDITFKQAVNKFATKKLAGTEPGKQEEADKAVVKLTESFGGDEGFFKTDFTKTKNRTIAAPLIRRYEVLSGTEFTATDKADIKEINVLVEMAKSFTGNVDPETAGFFDANFRKVKNTLSDEIDKGILSENTAIAAYNSYRNLVLRALSGATLTESEIELFKESFGSLTQQFPAVITQFQNALVQLKSRLASVSDLNDPYLAYYYMRNSPEGIGKIINSLDIVLEQFSQKQGNLPGEIIPGVNNLQDTDDAMKQWFIDSFGPVPTQNIDTPQEAN